jgi:hypothetical protein
MQKERQERKIKLDFKQNNVYEIQGSYLHKRKLINIEN